MDPEAELIEKVAERAARKSFFEPIIYEDRLDDWSLAKDFGEFLIRQDPNEVMGHALVARACRHLGDIGRARTELEECRVRTPHPVEKQMFLTFIAEEEKKLLAPGCPG